MGWQEWSLVAVIWLAGIVIILGVVDRPPRPRRHRARWFTPRAHRAMSVVGRLGLEVKAGTLRHPAGVWLIEPRARG